MRFLRSLITLVLAAIVTSPPGSACSIAFTPISVGASFSVKVSGYEGVKGLLLKLTGDSNDRAQAAVTDSSGVAQDCLGKGKYAERVRGDVEAGRRLGVEGTPTFFIGKVEANAPAVKVVVRLNGVRAYPEFQQGIDKLLAAE